MPPAFDNLASKVPPIAVLLLTTACAPIPKLAPAPTIAPVNHYAASQSLASDKAEAWPQDAWWSAYGDPQLDALIREALADSPDIAAAAARFRVSQAYAIEAGAAQLPHLDVSGAVRKSKMSYNNGFPATFLPKGWNNSGQARGDFGFDIDIWGRNRAFYAAARSEADAARLDYAQAALLLSTGVADAYADLARLEAERDVQQEAVSLRGHTAKLVSDRVESGLDTQAELKQASAAVPAARAELAAIDEEIVLTRNRLAALLGKGPDRGITIARPTIAVKGRGIPEDVTTNLIGRRPDIAAARARVEAEASRIKVARADFYPAISLGAVVGYQSLGLDLLFRKGSIYGDAGPAVSLPIFRGGQLIGRYRGARAGYDAAVADYDRVVTGAYQNVADAVASRKALDVRLAESRQALTDSEAAFRVARLRYEGGLSTFLEVLTAQERALAAQRIVTDLEARAFTLDIALIRALGGGFSSASAPDSKDSHNG